YAAARAYVGRGLFGALEKCDRVRHLAHSAPRPREKRVGERHTPSIGHLLAHRRTAFQGFARLMEVSFEEGRRTEVGERERGHSRRTDFLSKRQALTRQLTSLREITLSPGNPS